MTNSRKMPIVLLALDLAAVVVVFNVVNHFRGLPEALVIVPLLAPAALFVFSLYLVDGYRARTDMRSIDYTSLHIIAVLSALLATLVLTWVFIPHGYELQSSRAVVNLSFVILIPLTLAHRNAIYRRMAASRTSRSLLFLGDGESCAAFAAECRKMEVKRPVVYSWPGASASDPAALAAGIVLQPFDEALREVREGRLELEAIVLRESNRELPPAAAQQLVQFYFSGVPTYTLELFYQVQWQKIPLYRINPEWLFQEGFQIAREPVFERLKRASDIVISILGLACTAPVMLLASIAIWIEDRGAPVFRQSRVGKNQVPFLALKLRTMRTSDGRGDPYTRPGDARITRMGRFLRAGRLDELPQLWNVLRGEMSLIGPRAEWSRLAEEYGRQIPCYNYRHLVKPGITGWAQVNFTYGTSREDAARKLEYDLYYIRHFSFILDASIALKTVQIMLFGKGR